MATRLDQLNISEVSGVASPANEIPGWLVTKAKDGDMTEILKDLDRMESDFAILYSALKACEQYMADADPDVQSAATTLTQYIEGLFADAPADEEAPPDEPPVAQQAAAPVAASKSFTSGRGFMERLLGVVDKSTTDTKEEATVASTQEPAAKSAEHEDEPIVTEPTEAEKAAAERDEQLTTALKGIGEALVSLKEGQDATRDAVSAVIDRVGTLEANRHSATLDDYEPSVAKSIEDPTERATAALHETFKHLGRNPGSGVRLGV